MCQHLTQHQLKTAFQSSSSLNTSAALSLFVSSKPLKKQPFPWPLPPLGNTPLSEPCTPAPPFVPLPYPSHETLHSSPPLPQSPSIHNHLPSLTLPRQPFSLHHVERLVLGFSLS